MHQVNQEHRGAGFSQHLGCGCPHNVFVAPPSVVCSGRVGKFFEEESELLVNHIGGWLGGVGGGKQYLFLREGCRSSDRVRDGGV